LNSQRQQKQCLIQREEEEEKEMEKEKKKKKKEKKQKEKEEEEEERVGSMAVRDVLSESAQPFLAYPAFIPTELRETKEVEKGVRPPTDK
jgi:peptide subunit release factor 1 (eRF1)